MLFVDVADPDLTTDGDRLFYRGEAFSGETTESLPDAVVVESISYENGYREGECQGWHTNGARRYTGVFARGRKVDVWQYWSELGELVQEDEFDTSGGLRRHKRWDDSGVLVEDFDAAALAKPLVRQPVARTDPNLVLDPIANVTRYRGRPFTGQTVAYFYDGGPVVDLEWFVDGYSDGPDLSWFGDGARRSAGVLARNRPIGLWLDWYQNGAVRHESVYDASGRLILRQEWDEAGELTECRTYPLPSAESAPISETDRDLVRDAATGRLDRAGSPFTGRLETRTDGILAGFQDYRDGYPNGLSVEYEDGRERRKGVADANGPVGCWYEFRPDGRISREECYDNRNRLLLDRHWDESGALDRPASGLALLDNGTARRGEIDATAVPESRRVGNYSDEARRADE